MLISAQIAIFQGPGDQVPTTLAFGIADDSPLYGVLIQVMQDQIESVAGGAAASLPGKMGFKGSTGVDHEPTNMKEGNG